MFENIFWAKAVEPVVAEVDKISPTSIEAVLKNLDRLATYGMWAIGIILGIAAIVIGYNIWVSERTIRKLRKEFEKTIAATKREFENRISSTAALLSAKTNRSVGSSLGYLKRYNVAALLLSRAISDYVESKDKEGEKYIPIMFELIDTSLGRMIKSKHKISYKDKTEIKRNIGKAPAILKQSTINIEEKLDKVLVEKD